MTAKRTLLKAALAIAAATILAASPLTAEPAAALPFPTDGVKFTLQPASNPALCADATPQAEFIFVQLNPCNPLNTNQHWTYDTNQRLVNVGTGECAEARGGVVSIIVHTQCSAKRTQAWASDETTQIRSVDAVQGRNICWSATAPAQPQANVGWRFCGNPPVPPQERWGLTPVPLP